MSGVYLRDLKGDINKVKSSLLDEKIGKTKQGMYRSEIRDYFIDQISSNGKISFPTMQKFMEMFPAYRDAMLDLYKDKMESTDLSIIDVDTALAQASLFDSLCFVYDTQKNEYTLATMHFELLYDFQIEYDMLKQVFLKNKESIIKSYRIDIDYSESSEEFTFKATNARDYDIDDCKPDGSDGKRFYLIPYICVSELMNVIDYLLDKGIPLRVHQALVGVEKVRFISKDYNLLSSMCDVPDAVKGLKCRYFPLSGFLYAPVVGAPSTTAMVTNINVFDIYMIKGVREVDYKRFNVKKPEDPIRSVFSESLVTSTLINIKNVDIGDFKVIIDKLPYRNKFLANDVEEIGTVALTKYLHSVTNTAREKIYKILGIDEEINRRMEIVKTGREMTKDEIANIDSVLRKSIVRVTIQRKDCKLSSILCTNNKDVLRYLYGENYVRVYESFSSRYYMFLYWLKSYELDESNIDGCKNEIISKLYDVGLSCDDCDADAVIGAFRKAGNNTDDEVYVDLLKEYFADAEDVDYRRSTSQSKSKTASAGKGIILARSLSAYIDEFGEVNDYYRYVDRNKIISGIVF